MPDGPQPIFTDNPGSLPATFTVPAGISIELSSVFAKIDGSGTASSFYPCLTVRSQDGHIIARVKQDDTYASGDTGDATWSPFLRTPGSSTPPPAGSAASACDGGANTFTPGGSTPVPWDFFQTNDTATFNTSATNGGAINNTSGDTWLRCSSAGLYRFVSGAQFSGAALDQELAYFISDGSSFELYQGTPDSHAYTANVSVLRAGYWILASSSQIPFYVQVSASKGTGANDVDVNMGAAYWSAPAFNFSF